MREFLEFYKTYYVIKGNDIVIPPMIFSSFLYTRMDLRSPVRPFLFCQHTYSSPPVPGTHTCKITLHGHDYIKKYNRQIKM